jgi:hypothetical protein
MMANASPEITLCCLLWARPGLSDELTAYEDAVLALVADHGAVVLQRVMSTPISDGADDRPDEVQTFWFPNQNALDGFLADPRRQERADERDRVIARTELFPVRVLGDGEPVGGR